jgi:DNA repair photolyase
MEYQITRRAGSFLKQFGGAGDNTIVCFPFWQAVVASGCPGECSYCFLQTQRPYVTGRYALKGTLFSNVEDLEGQARRWLLQHKTPTGLIVGENQDGLAFERPYHNAGFRTPLEILVPLFERENPHGHTLVVLSKFTTTEFAERSIESPARNVVFSWSLSLPSISERYERKVAPLERRLEWGRRMRWDGWRVRFRLDALAPIEGWEQELDDVVLRITNCDPEMLTLGALRASNPGALRAAAAANGRDASIFDYLETRDPSGFKARTNEDFHVAAFRRVREKLGSWIKLGLCKEDVSLWAATGTPWQGCHCLHGAEDQVALTTIRRLRDRLPAKVLEAAGSGGPR